MKNLYFGEAFKLITKTMPFIWIRLGSYLVLGLALSLIFGIAGGLSWMLAKLWAPLGFIIFLVAFGGAFGLMKWASRYYFYLLKAAHTAVMTEIITTGKVPEGSQVAYGKAQVMNRFRDTSLMFGVDRLVDGVVKAVIRNFARLADLLPIPGLDSLMGLVQRVAVASSTYVDEAILSRAYARREQNVWKVAQDGVILYAQAWKPILTNAVVLALLSYVEFVALIILFALPALALAFVFPALKLALGIAVVVMALMVKLAVSDAFSMAATLLAYHRATEGLAVNAEWKSKLEGVSSKFKELGQKAATAVTPAAYSMVNTGTNGEAKIAPVSGS
ncbi:MAG: hypothetical protein KC422_25935 [Trueperaceae bacterium]|nr:hypothetical protein [Trueperaceae bacterium]